MADEAATSGQNLEWSDFTLTETGMAESHRCYCQSFCFFFFIQQFPYRVLWEGVLTQKVTSKKDGIPVRHSFDFHTEQHGRKKVCLKEEGPG